MGKLPPGVRLRGKRYWIDRRTPEGRVRMSLRVTVGQHRERELVEERAWAVGACIDRGLWTPELTVEEIVAAAHGDWKLLRPAGSVTVGSEFKSFLRAAEGQRSPRTVEQYTSVLARAERALGGSTELSAVSLEDAEAFLFGQGWAANTVRAARAVLVQVWRRAIRREALSAQGDGRVPALTLNPWEEVQAPKRPKARPRVLSREEWLALLGELREDPSLALFMGCAFLGGLRKMETARLRWEHWDWDARLLHVPGTKTEAAARSVPVPPMLWDLFERHAIVMVDRSEWVFPSPSDFSAPLPASTAGRWAAEAYRIGGFDPGRENGLTYHTGRHSFATWLGQDNVSPAIGAALLGDTVEMYTSTYLHLGPDDYRFAVESLL